MSIIVVFLESLEPGVARIQMLTAIELELAAMFIILGFTGLSKKLNTMVPPAVKAGIVLGAGVTLSMHVLVLVALLHRNHRLRWWSGYHLHAHVLTSCT